jgi:exosome complex RNA-binding protein Rrp4
VSVEVITVLPQHVISMDGPVRIHPMTDHYAILCGDRVVGVVCRANETQWRVDVLEGRVDGANYVPLYHALEAAMKWRPM